MDHTNPNFVSFMQTNYKTIRVSYLHPRGAAPTMPAPSASTSWGGQHQAPAPAWSDAERPWAVAEELRPAQPSVPLYSYKVPKDVELKVGDIVVVPSNDTITFARVEVVDDVPTLDFTANVVYKWIVGKVDFDEYNALVKAEVEFSRKMADVQRMRVQQEAIVTMRNQYLDGADPQSAALFVEALKTIGAQVPTPPVQTPSAESK